jgi:hypothetical protein
VIWPHGPEKLNDFLNHDNAIHPNILVTFVAKPDGHLAFRDVDIYGRPDGSFGYTTQEVDPH